jgi:hypothetical protein
MSSLFVRPAEFTDIPDVVAIIADGHKRSRYKDQAWCEGKLKTILRNAIMRHGKGREACAFVAVSGGSVVGVIVGVLDRLYGISINPYATDVFFLTKQNAPAKAAAALLNQFEQWAKSIPDLIEIRLGNTGAVVDYVKSGSLYDRRGYERDGYFFRKAMQ